MKILAVGDLHIKLATLEFIRGTLFPYLCDAIACHAIDTLVFLGDTLDYDKGTVNVLEMDCAIELFTRISERVKDVYVIVGNHDYVNAHQFLTDAHWMNSLKGKEKIHIVDRVIRDDYDIIFCPFVPSGRFMEALDTCVGGWRDCNLIFAHQAFLGAQWKGGQCTVGDEWSANLPPIVSGHIHARQKLDCGVWYTGSIEESHENYVAIITPDSIRMERVTALSATRRTGTVAEIAAAAYECKNCHITIQDTAENIATFRASDIFRALDSANVVRLVPQTLAFLELYRKNIADTGDVYTWCAAEKILEGVDQDEEAHLFVPTRHKQE